MISLILTLWLAAAPAGAASQVALSQDPGVAAGLQLYELWLQDQMVYLHQPGLSVGIVHDQELVWAKGFGYRDPSRELPAGPDTIYRIASITKTFTATAIMQLRDAGKLQLDDPVVRHLPWFSYRSRFPQGPVITVRHLLTHTSGLPRESAFPYWTDRNFPTREQMIEALANQESVFEPETRYKYSNLALALAGEVVAAVSGRPYEEYIREEILNPLGMKSTSVRFGTIDATRLATGYLIRKSDRTQPPAPPTISRGLTPAANMSSTVEDLARFISFQFRQGVSDGEPPVLRGSTLREMQRVHWLNPSWQSGRGLGFSVWRQDARTLVGHGGWVAGYRTQIAFDPAAKIGVIVLTNSDEGGPGSYVRQAFDVVAPALEKATAVEPTLAPVAEPGRYTGTYHSPSGELSEVLVLKGKLVIYDHSYPPASNPTSRVTELTPEAEHTFRMAGENGNGEQVVFELREDGKVGRVKVGENFIFPEGCGSLGEDLRCQWR